MHIYLNWMVHVWMAASLYCWVVKTEIINDPLHNRIQICQVKSTITSKCAYFFTLLVWWRLVGEKITNDDWWEILSEFLRYLCGRICCRIMSEQASPRYDSLTPLEGATYLQLRAPSFFFTVSDLLFYYFNVMLPLFFIFNIYFRIFGLRLISSIPSSLIFLWNP